MKHIVGKVIQPHHLEPNRSRKGAAQLKLSRCGAYALRNRSNRSRKGAAQLKPR